MLHQLNISSNLSVNSHNSSACPSYATFFQSILRLSPQFIPLSRNHNNTPLPLPTAGKTSIFCIHTVVVFILCHQWFREPSGLLGVATCAESRHQSSFGMSTVHLESFQSCLCSLGAFSAQSGPLPPPHWAEKTEPCSARLSGSDTAYHFER